MNARFFNESFFINNVKTNVENIWEISRTEQTKIIIKKPNNFNKFYAFSKINHFVIGFIEHNISL